MIDIIIPVYNSLNTLDRCLKSILKQTIINDLNIYIIDDASSDNYDNIINSYKNKMNIKYCKLNENKGPGYARNFGIDKSNSEYIIFIDSDDIFYTNNSINILKNKIINDNLDLVISTFIKEENNRLIPFIKDEINLHGKIYRRSFIKKHNIKFPYLYGEEDNAFNHLYLLYEPKKDYIKNITYENIYNEYSLTNINNKEYFNTFIYNFSSAFLYSLKQAIKDNCNNNLIAYDSFKTLLVIYTCAYIKEERLPYNDSIDNIKELINIYNNYKKYLTDENIKYAVISEIYQKYQKEILSLEISFNDFINLFK